MKPLIFDEIIGPHRKLVPIGAPQWASDLDLIPLGDEGIPARSLRVTSAGEGTLVARTFSGGSTPVPIHGLTNGANVPLNPTLFTHLIQALDADAAAVFQVDDPEGSPTYVDIAAAFNSSATGDTNFVPASEAVGDRTLVGFATPFNALSLVLGTAGSGGAVTWKYYSGSPDIYDSTAFTALTGLRGTVADITNLNTTTAGVVLWTVPDGWRPVAINGSDPLFWVALEVGTVWTTNPVGSQGRVQQRTTVNSILAAY